MGALDKYWRKMSNRRLAYCYTVLELMRRGYPYKEAKRMVENSDYLNYAEKEPSVFFHYSESEWADWIIREMASKGKLKYVG